jgi:hypothetical protein
MSTDLSFRIAPIRFANRAETEKFLKGPGPGIHQWGVVVDRKDTNLPDWYAPETNSLLRLDDEFIAHATNCERYKRLPRSWQMEDDDVAERRAAIMEKLVVRECSKGWLIEMHRGLCTSVLGCSFLEIPVLCPSKATAARLADAKYAEQKPFDQIIWLSRQVGP